MYEEVKKLRLLVQRGVLTHWQAKWRLIELGFTYGQAADALAGELPDYRQAYNDTCCELSAQAQLAKG
jgi:hypothetical protein